MSMNDELEILKAQFETKYKQLIQMFLDLKLSVQEKKDDTEQLAIIKKIYQGKLEALEQLIKDLNEPS